MEAEAEAGMKFDDDDAELYAEMKADAEVDLEVEAEVKAETEAILPEEKSPE